MDSPPILPTEINGFGSIDLNGDVGEGFGVYRIEHEEELLARITSANIACGFHAGDPATMRRTVRLCLERGVALGAHPGLPDRQGFGRRELKLSADEAYELVLYQIGALQAFVRAEGGVLRHVKPHGALYNMAARDETLAMAIAKAIRSADERLVLYGLAGSQLIKAGLRLGLRTAQEAFADRVYNADGTLMPRTQPGAVIREADRAARQVLRIVRRGEAVAEDGTILSLRADTVCLHGDGAGPALMAARIRAILEAEGIRVAPLS